MLTDSTGALFDSSSPRGTLLEARHRLACRQQHRLSRVMGIVVSLQLCIWPVLSSDHVAWCGARSREKFGWDDPPWLGGVLEHPLHVVPFFANPLVVIEERKTDAVSWLHQGIAEKRDSESIDGCAECHVSAVLRQEGEAGNHEGHQHDHPGGADNQKKQKDTAARLAGKLDTSFKR